MQKKYRYMEWVIGCFMLIISQISMAGVNNLPGVRAPLSNVKITQITDFLLRVTITLNPLLPASHSYNMGVFSVKNAIATNCENYPDFNGCYFSGITTSSTIEFLLVGDFSAGWQSSQFAILVVYSALPPEATSRPGLGPVASHSVNGITAPIRSSATIEYYPFSRLSG